MTGTDRSVADRLPTVRRALSGLSRATVALGLGLGTGLVGATMPSEAVAQEPQVVTIRSGSGWIGVNVRVVTSLDPDEDEITLTDVLAGSPAAEAGLEPGDRVIGVNGVPVTADRFRSITSRLEAGDPIAITVLRDGEEIDLSVIAGQRPEPAQIVAVRLQEELDSVHSRFVRILQSPEPPEVRAVRAEGGRFVEAPTIRVEQIGADSIATRILIRSEGGPVLSFIETPEGISPAQWVELSAVAAAPAPPSEEMERMVREVEAQAQAQAAAVATTWTPLRREALAAAERAEREARLQAGQWPARSIEEVRPLSPYLAGLTRVAGAELRTLNPGLAQYFGVAQGLLVTEVSEGTPAAEAGLRGGDVIVTAGGREVTTLGELRESLATRDGRRLEVIRAGERIPITLR